MNKDSSSLLKVNIELLKDTLSLVNKEFYQKLILYIRHSILYAYVCIVSQKMLHLKPFILEATYC